MPDEAEEWARRFLFLVRWHNNCRKNSMKKDRSAKVMLDCACSRRSSLPGHEFRMQMIFGRVLNIETGKFLQGRLYREALR